MVFPLVYAACASVNVQSGSHIPVDAFWVRVMIKSSPPVSAVPVTDATQSSSVLSPTLTVTPCTMLAAVRLVVVTALMVCAPVRYLPDAIVWSVVDGWIVCAA